MAGLTVGFLLPVTAGWCVVSALWPRPLKRRTKILRACLAAGLGLGLSSAVFFLASAMWAPSRAAAVRGDVLLLASSIAFFYRARARASKSAGSVSPAIDNDASAPTGDREGAGGFGPVFRVLWLAMLVVAVLIFVARARSFPHGSWDAWSSWNLRARFLYRGESDWQEMFNPLIVWTSPRYPLLLSASVARLWFYAGREAIAAPIATAAVFSLGTVGVLGYGLDALRRRAQGRFTATLLLATPVFALYGAYQYADAAVAFYLVAALVLVCLAVQHEVGRVGLLALAGCFAALTAWTKEEGLLALALIVFGTAVGFMRAHPWRDALKRASPLVAGAIPVGVVVAYFKIAYAPETPYLAGGSLVGRLTDVSNYALIGRAFIREIVGFGEWTSGVALLETRPHIDNGWFSMTVLLFLLVVFARRRPNGITRIQRTAVVIALAGMMVAFLVAFLLTPLNLDVHLFTSLPRLLGMVWPSALLLVGLSIGFGRSEGLSSSAQVPV